MVIARTMSLRRQAYMTEATLLRRSGCLSVTGLRGVTELSLRGSATSGRIQTIESLSLLRGLRHLDISGNMITSLEPLSAKTAPALAYLDASRNQLLSVAPLGTLRGSLTHLDVTGNRIERLPSEVLGGMTRLRHLALAHNQAGRAYSP